MHRACCAARIWRDILEAGASERTLAEHEQIYSALQRHDPARAEEVALEHVRSTESWLRHVLDAATELSPQTVSEGSSQP